MPKFALPSRPVIVAASTAMVAATSLALLVSSAVTAPPAGAAVAPGTTIRASVHDGTNAQDEKESSFDSVISANGNAIAFTSNAQFDNLGTGGSFNSNVFVRDLVTNRTVMISRGQFVRDTGPTIGVAPPSPAGGTVVKLGGDKVLDLGAPRLAAAQPALNEVPPDGPSSSPTISADGRYVAFRSLADNIVRDSDPNNYDILMCDRDPDGDGIFDEDITDPSGRRIRDYRYFRVSDIVSPNVGSVFPSLPHMSADAGRVTWEERVFPPSGGLGTDRVKFATLPLENGRRVGGPVELLNPNPGGGFFVDEAHNPVISGNGRFVVLQAIVVESCDCSDPARHHSIFSVDLQLRQQTTRVDLEGGKPISENISMGVRDPAVNFDGTVIAFVGEQKGQFGGGSQFNQPNVYVAQVDYSRPVNQRSNARVESRNNKGAEVNGETPAVSADGRYLAFQTDSLDTHDGVDREEIQDSCLAPSDLAGSKLLQFNAALPPERPDIRTFCQLVVRDLVVDRVRDPLELRLPGTLVTPGLTTDCTDNLPVGATCAARRDSFEPSLSADGSRIGFYSSSDDLVPQDTNNRQDVFVRTLQPALQANPLDFGPVQLGTSITRTVTLQEVGNGPLAVEAVTLGGTNAADFTILGDTCTGQILHEAGTCSVTMQFEPRTTGDRNGTLTVRVRGNRTFPVRLVGSGTEKPVPRGAEFSANPSPVEFGKQLLLSPSPNSTITVTNNGETALQISNVSVVGPGATGDFAIVGNTCGGNAVQPKGSCTVSVRYTPQAPGDRAATLQFTDNAAGGPHLVGLHGIAGAPTLEFSPGVTQPGRVVTAIGKGFPPNKKVFVKFPNAVDNSTATADANGNFSVALLIFKKSKPETRSAVATVDGFPTITANAPLLIVFPTVSPADFVVRG